MMKFKPGDHVFLFNSLAWTVEEDDIYGALFVPMPVEGVTQDSGARIAEKIEKGQMKVQEQYQLCSHQGIVDADVLFASEAECREAYRKFFAE